MAEKSTEDRLFDLERNVRFLKEEVELQQKIQRKATKNLTKRIKLACIGIVWFIGGLLCGALLRGGT
jgi:hypothetical protein